MPKGYAGHWAKSTNQTKHGPYFHILFLAISVLLPYVFLGFLPASDDDDDDNTNTNANNNNKILSRTFYMSDAKCHIYICIHTYIHSLLVLITTWKKIRN